MTLSILVVDDSELTRLMHVSIVESLGHRAVEAANGMQALELLTRGKVDLILADLNMPVMDGYTFVAAVRGFDDFCDIPILVASTEAGESDRRRAYEAGADVYLVKPLEAHTLRQRITLLLGEQP